MVKKLLFLMTMSVGMFFPTMAQNVPSYVPTNGLVGWWPFNGNTNDESGNGNHFTPKNGVSSTTNRFNINNSCYLFDGKDDYLDLNNFILPTEFSLSLWISINERKEQAIFYQGVNEFHFGVFAPDFLIRSGIKFQNDTWYFTKNGIDYKLGTWLNFTTTFERGKTVKLYLNSILVDESDLAPNISFWNPNLKSSIGSYNSNSRWFNGKLDDIAIYNRALTQEEITALYTSTPPCTNPTATITPQGNTTFCQGGFVNLNASTGTNYTYEWYNNGQIINGATASTYQANTSGSYTVKVTDGSCSTISGATIVTVNPYPSSTVQTSGNTTLCLGNSVTLTSSGVGTYLWSNGATTKSITVTETGNYSVQVTQNSCTSTSSVTSVTVNPIPTASITPQGNTTFCQGGFVNLVANGGTSYQWNTGASSSSITANQSGTYVVNVFNSFGCQASASQIVTVNKTPVVSITNLNDFTLKNQAVIELIGSPLGGDFVGDGINGASFNPANITLGKKMVTYTYTSPQGCKGSATRSTIIVDSVGNVCNVTKYDTVTVKNNVYDTILKLKFKLTTGINANQMTSMTLYPNPTTDVLYIEIGDAKALDGYRYRIIDAVGKEVYNQLVKNTKTEIPLKSLGAAGMYLFEVIDQQSKTIQSNKIVLE